MAIPPPSSGAFYWSPTKGSWSNASVPRGGKQFAATVAQWIEKTDKDISLAVKGVIISLFSKIIMRNPVDTGRSRSNWNVGIDMPSMAPVNEFDTGMFDPGPVNDQGIGPSSAKDKAIAAVNATDPKKVSSYFLTNNIIYALDLEYGWSRQAPGGMVRLSVMEFQRIVDEIVAQIK